MKSKLPLGVLARLLQVSSGTLYLCVEQAHRRGRSTLWWHDLPAICKLLAKAHEESWQTPVTASGVRQAPGQTSTTFFTDEKNGRH